MAIALMKMFWKSMYMPSKINTILEKEDATLEEVVAEEDVVDECKTGNTKLLDFLTKNENLEKLVNMMVDEPPADVEEKLKYKNAHLACEILTSDSSQITDALSERGDLLEKIYSFFEGVAPVNPLQASFFSKTMGLLITHKSEKMLDFFKSHEDFTERLVGHLDTSAIADLLLRLVTCIDNVTCRNQCFQWLHEQNLVKHLVGLMDVSKSNEVHSNASQSICDIIRLSREHQYQHHSSLLLLSSPSSEPPVAPDDVLLRTIESSETVNELLDRALPGDDASQTSESLVVNAVLVVQTLLEPRKASANIFSIVEDTIISELDESDKENDRTKFGEGDCSSSSDNNSNEHVNRIMECVLSRLQGFFNVLTNPPKQRFDPMPSTFGELRPPLGPSRLAVVRFFNALLSLGRLSASADRVERKMAELGVASKLVSLFFEYPWNNFLHGEVERFVFHAVNSTSSRNPILTELLRECNLLERICDELELFFKKASEGTGSEPTTADAAPSSAPIRKRPGYLGHLTSMASLLAGKFKSLPDLLKDSKPEIESRWNEFVSTTLVEIVKINNADLGVGIGSGQGHASSSEDEDDEEDFHSLLPPHDNLQRAFNNYQGQLLTTEFPESFGFNDDDFNESDEPIGSPFKDRISSLDFNLDSVEDSPVAAASFRQACQDRIQQFDCSSGEEDEEEEASDWPSLRGRHVPRLNLLDAMERECKSRDKKEEEEEHEDDFGDNDDADDYRNDFDDSEDDLDSPAIIVSQQSSGSDDAKTKSNLPVEVNGTEEEEEEEEEDDDYESLHDSNSTSVMDASFVGGDEGEEEEEAEEVRVNGTATDHDAEEVGDSGSRSPKVVPSKASWSIKTIGAGDVGSAVDAESQGT